MRSLVKLFIVLGAAVFAAGIASMLMLVVWSYDLSARDQLTSNLEAGIVVFAIAGYLVAGAGSTLIRSAGAELKAINERELVGVSA